jgi:hypothetical protein
MKKQKERIEIRLIRRELKTNERKKRERKN